jgi:hypothetical protein
MEKQFEIRTYGFNELAQLYFPNVTKTSATKMFSSWINSNASLNEKLKILNWKKGSRNLTPKQVKALIGHFDPP